MHFAMGDARVHKDVAMSLVTQSFVESQRVDLGSQGDLCIAKVPAQSMQALHQGSAVALPPMRGQHGDATDVRLMLGPLTEQQPAGRHWDAIEQPEDMCAAGHGRRIGVMLVDLDCLIDALFFDEDPTPDRQSLFHLRLA